MATVSWKLREKKQKTNTLVGSCRLLYLCKMWSLAQWRPRWNVVCWWLQGNYFENLNFSSSFVWYRANTWHNLMTILTVLLLDISKSVWGFGKLKLNEENSPASCFPVFSIARALHYTTLPLERRHQVRHLLQWNPIPKKLKWFQNFSCCITTCLINNLAKNFCEIHWPISDTISWLHLENSTTHTHTWYWGKSRKSFVFFPSPLTSISWWCCLVYSMSYSQNFVAFVPIIKLSQLGYSLFTL